MTVVFVLLFIISRSYCFNENDIQVVASLIQPLVIKQCILVMTIHDQISIITSKMKVFSEKNVFAVYFDISKFAAYLKMGNFPNVRTAIILKVANSSQLSSISRKLKFQISDPNVCSRFIWMLLLPKNLRNINRDHFQVPFNCEFILIIENEGGYELTEIYKISSGSNLTLSNLGYYDSKYGFEKNREYRRKKNLEGREMIMAIPNKGSWTFITECLHFELWNDMGKVLNYSTTTIKMRNLKKTKIKPDVSNIVQAFHHLTKNTNHMIAPVLTAKAHMYIRRIEDNHKFWKAYLQPFHKSIWTAICYWIIMSSSAITIIGYCTSRVLSLQGFTLLDQGLIPVTVLCNQGYTQRPHVVSSRIARICAFIVSGVIFPAYSASIISFLTIDKTKLPFTGFETFVMDKTYKLAALNNAFFISFFEDNEDKVIQTVREKYLINYTEFPLTHEDSVDMLCERSDISLIILNYKILQIWSPCKITIIPYELLRLNSGYELANDGLQYRKSFLELLLKFRSIGVINRANKIMFGKTDFTTANDFTPIEISVIVSLIAVLFCGVISSVIFFTMELKSAGQFNQEQNNSVILIR